MKKGDEPEGRNGERGSRRKKGEMKKGEMEKGEMKKGGAGNNRGE